MNIDLTTYEINVIIRALIDYKHKIIGYANMTEEDKNLLRELYKDCNKIVRKLSK